MRVVKFGNFTKPKKPWKVEGVEWREVKLGNLIELKYGKGLPKRVRQEGNIPVYGSNGIIGYHNESLTNAPTIIVGRKGSAGETWLSFVPCWVIDTAFYVELKEKRLDWKYLYLYTKLIKRHLVFPKRVKPGINRRDYLKITIPLPFRNGKPDIEKQKEIANYLDSVYEKIRALKEKNQINHLEEMKESILDEVFDHEKNTKWID